MTRFASCICGTTLEYQLRNVNRGFDGKIDFIICELVSHSRVYMSNVLPTIPRHGLLRSSYFCINIVYYYRGTEQFHL